MTSGRPLSSVDRTETSRPSTAAAEALRLAQSDPIHARQLAQAVLLGDGAPPKPASVSLAERAMGLAAREEQDLAASETHLRRAVRVADKAGLTVLAADARVSLAGTLALKGDWSGAIREADRAGAVLRGLGLARLDVQRSAILMTQGRLDESIDGFRRALPVLRRHGDRLWEARLRANRGLAHHYRGALAAAESDLRKAADLYTELGQPRLAASARQNLGLVVGLMGDIPASLRWFEQADTYFNSRGIVDPRGLSDRSQALLSAGLISEARAAAEFAVESLARQGQKGHLAIARLKLAEAALLDGDPTAAREMADTARRAFVRQHRPGWAALARHVAVRAVWATGERSPALLHSARRTADELARNRFVLPAADARLLAAQLALCLGRVETARRELDRASRARRRGTVQLKARAWHAEALLRLADGNRRGAKAALCAGVDVLERYRAVLGATELRAHASGHVAEVARAGLGLAIEDGAPEEVLAWMERWRAGALRMRPVRPPEDSRLAADLGELRAVVAALDTASLEGKPTARLLARQAALEEAVRGRARQATGILAASLATRPDLPTITATLHGQSLIEYAEHEGVLHAVTVSGDRAKLHRLGPVAEIHTELDRLLSSLRRMALGRGSPASIRAFTDAATFGAMRLDALLLRPVRHAVADGPLVVVPTGALHALPWSALPSCTRLPVTVAPSATVWHRAACAGIASAVGEQVVLVAGPRLPGATNEIAALARHYPDALCLTESGAACHAVVSAFDGAAMAHVAAHGRFRIDNPLFSCIELADGPLTVYDLEGLRRPPELFVLSACESGSSGVRPGNELMGLVAALLALGTRTVVASLFPVPDDATKALMISLHCEMRKGAAPAEALARAQAVVSPEGPTGLAAAAAFTCFGAGGKG